MVNIELSDRFFNSTEAEQWDGSHDLVDGNYAGNILNCAQDFIDNDSYVPDGVTSYHLAEDFLNRV